MYHVVMPQKRPAVPAAPAAPSAPAKNNKTDDVTKDKTPVRAKKARRVEGYKAYFAASNKSLSIPLEEKTTRLKDPSVEKGNWIISNLSGQTFTLLQKDGKNAQIPMTVTSGIMDGCEFKDELPEVQNISISNDSKSVVFKFKTDPIVAVSNPSARQPRPPATPPKTPKAQPPPKAEKNSAISVRKIIGATATLDNSSQRIVIPLEKGTTTSKDPSLEEDNWTFSVSGKNKFTIQQMDRAVSLEMTITNGITGLKLKSTLPALASPGVRVNSSISGNSMVFTFAEKPAENDPEARTTEKYRAVDPTKNAQMASEYSDDKTSIYATFTVHLAAAKMTTTGALQTPPPVDQPWKVSIIVFSLVIVNMSLIINTLR